MALLIRPLFTHQASLFTQHQATICRGFSMATVLAGRKRHEKLDVPKDKSGVIIGKRKASVYFPKVFALLAMIKSCLLCRKEFQTKPTQSMSSGRDQCPFRLAILRSQVTLLANNPFQETTHWISSIRIKLSR